MYSMTGEMRKTQSDLPVPAMKAVILHRQVPTHTKRVSTLSSKKRNKYHPSQPRRDRKEINESLEKMKQVSACIAVDLLE